MYPAERLFFRCFDVFAESLAASSGAEAEEGKLQKPARACPCGLSPATSLCDSTPTALCASCPYLIGCFAS